MTAAQPLDVFVEPGDAPLLAAEIVRLFSDKGFRKQRNRARLAFLLEEWGVERFRAALETRWGQPFDSEGADMRLPHRSDHLGVQPQMKPGLYSVGLCVPTGRMVSEQVDDLAHLAEVYGSGEIRLTIGQNAILVNVAEDRLDDLMAEPLLEQFSSNPHPNIAGLVTCTGSDYCSLALIDTKSVGRWITEELIKQYPEAPPVTMHWSGCPAGCGNHQAADIGFQGCRTRVNDKVFDGVQIFVGGRTGNQARPGVRIMDLIPVDTLEDILPVIIKHLELLKQVQRKSKTEKLVLMVPALTRGSS
jgi:ferredoxin-nitrite reductase